MAHIEAVNLEGAEPVETGDNPDILFELGMMYSTGRVGSVDLVSAHKWFNLAAWKGCTQAAERRREIAAMMSDADIATAQRAARAWLTRH